MMYVIMTSCMSFLTVGYTIMLYVYTDNLIGISNHQHALNAPGRLFKFCNVDTVHGKKVTANGSANKCIPAFQKHYISAGIPVKSQLMSRVTLSSILTELYFAVDTETCFTSRAQQNQHYGTTVSDLLLS